MSLVKDLLEIKELEQKIIELELDMLDNGSGIETTLMTNRVQLHKTCRLGYNLKKGCRDGESQLRSCSSFVHPRFTHGLLTNMSRLKCLYAFSIRSQLVLKCSMRHQQS